MRAYELMKETFSRKMHIWIVHVVWLVLYGIFWIILLPEDSDFGFILFIWGGCLLPLALSTGIFGDDIASGRICVLMTKPFWPGELYIYRLMGLSFQAALHFVLAGCVIFIVHTFIGKGSLEDLGSWLFSSWLLFNVCAALSTSLSVVIRRSYNSLLLFVAILAVHLVVSVLSWNYSEETGTKVFMHLLRYAGPPFELLHKLGKGEYGEYSLIVGKYSLVKSVACVTHSLVLTVLYSIVGIILLSKRQFTCEQS